MSRHPDNPYWSQTDDKPIMIGSRRVWAEAEAAGYLTAEHVFARLHAIAMHEMDGEGPVAYDADGFVTALTAEGIRLQGGVTLTVHTRDHQPPHAHITFTTDPSIDLRINLQTGELMNAIPKGRAKMVKHACALVVEHHDLLANWWVKNHGPFSIS
ncbi:hypothetical protein [Nocardia sp. CA-145437]|uniref:hypothetical protein n=1 Tax=unclassified Nocardia TaxID=2637762 RepID=UPI003D97E8C6